jgi:hypothetical protein
MRDYRDPLPGPALGLVIFLTLLALAVAAGALVVAAVLFLSGRAHG